MSGLSGELLDMAKRAGLVVEGDPIPDFDKLIFGRMLGFEAFARLVAEDCAKVLDSYLDNGANPELALANIRRKYGLSGD